LLQESLSLLRVRVFGELGLPSLRKDVLGELVLFARILSLGVPDDFKMLVNEEEVEFVCHTDPHLVYHSKSLKIQIDSCDAINLV